jgi:hypothetical protein
VDSELHLPGVSRDERSPESGGPANN